MAAPDSLNAETKVNSLYSSPDAEQITASASPLARPTRMIRVFGSGLLTVTTGAGTTKQIQAYDGDFLPLVITHLTVIGAGITRVEAYY